ncbi:MAG: hypothetical protein ACI3YC_08930, partial [Alloprevotella sp.]
MQILREFLCIKGYCCPVNGLNELNTLMFMEDNPPLDRMARAAGPMRERKRPNFSYLKSGCGSAKHSSKLDVLL